MTVCSEEPVLGLVSPVVAVATPWSVLLLGCGWQVICVYAGLAGAAARSPSLCRGRLLIAVLCRRRTIKGFGGGYCVVGL